MTVQQVNLFEKDFQ